jgi:hypothetical protein
MKLKGPGAIALTWLEWEQHTAGMPGMGLSWWQHPLKHLQHWFCGTFLGHTLDKSMDEFIFEAMDDPRGAPPRIAALSDAEIDVLLNTPPAPPRETKWSGL